MLLRTIKRLLSGMSDPSPFLPLATEEQFDEAVERSHQEPLVIYKHSSTCSISARARHKLSTLGEHPPVYQLVVQDARSLSQAIAERFGIRHESPQAIVLYRGEPVDHASHSRVTPQFVSDTIEQAASS